MTIFAAVEGGGTTFRMALAEDRPDNIIERAEIKTTTPDETLGKARAWLDARKFDALGVATFGPIEPRKSEKKYYGYITSTPKPNWQQTNVLGALVTSRGGGGGGGGGGTASDITHSNNGSSSTVPVKFDTDVNAPAFSEYSLNPGAQEQTSCAYVTVGTGVGVGLVVNGKPVHGLLHPEGGHIHIKR